ncbi:MAG: right-handed parallel beta-helix repeat-containing protein [Bacteroidetes bacterium]|nr:right-handed parallel beta-helix repeat-containing protein [Bacteroidota bacterium]MBU1579133.1 right-handed parallel beta-helix repeat-containing protein [Bacteroidota bacterium]MBU2557015.1 right-handed parallel beta-helix repeat-containing protein [Bacteroidota bacterium]
MKKVQPLLLFLLLLIVAGGVTAQSAYHNQDIYTSEIWTADSLHYITANITLHASATLTIQAGTEIRFKNGSTFTIQGSVHADGFSSLIHIKGDTGDNGRFTLVDAGDSWFKYVNFHNGGSLVIDSSDNVLVENCHFLDGSAQRPTGLTIQNNAEPEINQCQFYDDSYGMEITTASAPLISNCTFEGLGNAMMIRTGASPEVLNCNFTTNNIGISLVSAGEPLITNCIMNENNFHGAQIEGASSNPLFTNCEFNQNAESGIFIRYDGQGTFTDCQANLNGSHGLKINYSDGTVTLNNFAASQNGGDGVYARQSSLIVTGLEVNDNTGFGLNFYDDDESDNHVLQTADIFAHGNDTTAIRVPARVAGALLQPDVNLDFENNHPDGIEIFHSHIDENTIWPEPPLNIDLYLGGLYIAEEASLEIIHPNTLTSIYCRPEAEIQVIGTLKAENIQFLPAVEVEPPANKGYWKGIYFSNSDSSELTNVTVKNAGFSNTKDRFAGIEIHTSAPPQDSAVIINDCYVEDCAGDGIYIYRSNPLIKNTFIAGCDSSGIYMDYYSEPMIDSCIIMQNGSYGIFCNHQYSGGTLNAAQITNNQGPAVRLPMNMVGGLYNSTIAGNQRNERIEIAGGYMTDDATWPGDLEYYVYKQIRTDPGKLTLEPGAVLKFLPYTDLTVKSSLNAIGTSDQHIVFTSAQNDPGPQDWQGLNFHHATDTSHLTYCDIKYAGQSEWEPNIYTENSEVYLSHCDISYSGSSGIINMGGGDGKFLSITNSNIHHNQTHGLNSEWFWYNYTNLSHTNIYGNGGYAIVAPADVLRFFTENINIHSNGHDAIKVTGGYEPGAFDGQFHQGTWRNHGVPYEISQHISLMDGDTLTIEKGNTFYLADEVTFWVDGMLSATGTADSTITFTRMPESDGHWKHMLFQNDEKISEMNHCNFSHGGFYTETKNDTAAMIAMINAAANFQNCLIDSSNANGFYLNQNASATFTNTSIRENGTNGIYVGADGENTLNFGSSLASWNDIHSNTTFNISNNSPDAIEAGYIWWGTVEAAEINAGIHENTGPVSYAPWTNAAHTQLYPNTWTGNISADWNTADNWNPATVPTSDDDVLITANGISPVISTTIGASCNSIIVNAEAALTINSGGSLITEGIINNKGTINAELTLSDGEYHIISPPNNNSSAGMFAGDYLLNWNETTSSWDYITDPNELLIPATGYYLYGQSKTTTHTFNGTPNTGAQQIALSASGSGGMQGFNLVGNPYPSAIDWSLLDDTYGAVYYWDPVSESYLSWNNGSGTGSQYIAPMQGFFVYTDAEATLSFQNNVRTHTGANNFYKDDDLNKLSNGLILAASDENYTDELHLRFDENAASGFELPIDAWKLLTQNEGISQIYSMSPDGPLSIDVRPFEAVVPLGFANSQPGVYRIGLQDAGELESVVLEDLKENTFTDLLSGDYAFSWDEPEDENRFILHLSLMDVADMAAAESISIFAYENRLYLQSPNGQQNGILTITDLAGHQLLLEKLSLNGTYSTTLQLASGVYLVRFGNKKSVTVKKIWIQ